MTEAPATGGLDLRGLQLGRPGVYSARDRPRPALAAVRLDVAGFVGVAARGPVDQPTLVTGWADFELRFGGLESPTPPGVSPRLLSYGVRAFFAQGGQRAYVCRVVPPPRYRGLTEAEATATFTLDPAASSGPDPRQPEPRWGLAAANEGAWGSSLLTRLTFSVGTSFRARLVTLDQDTPGLQLPPGVAVVLPALVRIGRERAAPVLRWLTGASDQSGRSWRLVALDQPLAGAGSGRTGSTSTALEDPADEVEVDVVTATLQVSDPSDRLGRAERLTDLGLAPPHPRWLPRVLAAESQLLRATGDWTSPLPTDRLLHPSQATRLSTGADRDAGIDYDSFFDDGDADADPLDERASHRGVDAMGRVRELGLLAVPDLLTGLDGRDPADLAETVRRQQRVAQVAELRQRFVALTDVPARLPLTAVTSWRSRFTSSFCAAYHPWLQVAVPGAARATGSGGSALVAVPGSCFAAGIIAHRELSRGLSWGPAAELAAGAVLALDPLPERMHDQLHLLGVNVFARERDGFRLTAARTLSLDPDYRQLSVRRRMTMLALTLEQQTQWLVFEPNTSDLRARLVHTVTQLLRQLHREGAFAGRTEAESFFVSCDEVLNPTRSQALGRLTAEIGVAPAAPLEYLLLRISADEDGQVRVDVAADAAESAVPLFATGTGSVGHPDLDPGRG